MKIIKTGKLNRHRNAKNENTFVVLDRDTVYARDDIYQVAQFVKAGVKEALTKFSRVTGRLTA